jgi:hypothetical protein
MTRFLILYDHQFRVNDQCINKVSVQQFLRDLLKIFPYPKEFTIKDIPSNYTSKTTRAMIFIALQFKIVEILRTRQPIPKFYRFLPNASAMIETILTLSLSVD